MAIDTNVYFGTPGSLLTIPWPRGGITGPRLRNVSQFPLGSGGQQVWKTLSGKRAYQLGYQSLDYATFESLLAFDQGHNGLGPFALLDPGQRNQLTANQSAATSLTNGTDNFTVAGTGGSLSSDATLFLRGPRSLKWLWSITNPATAALSLDSPDTSWPGIPCMIRPYTFWFWARAAALSGPVTVQAVINYLSPSGLTLGTATGNATVAASGGWTQATVSGTPTAGSAFLNCSVAASGASISAGEAVNFDEFMLNEGGAPDAVWSPGTGVIPVQVVSLADAQPWFYPDYRSGPALVLQEVGP